MVLEFHKKPNFILLYKSSEAETRGVVKDLIKETKAKASVEKQIERFTDIKLKTEMYGIEFLKGTAEEPHEDTKLALVSQSRDEEIREVFNALNYGATMMHVGWKQPTWFEDEHFYNIIDVAARIGAGTASYGVDRYYVLLQDDDSDEFIILDVKQQVNP